MIGALLFDFDGVIANSSDRHLNAWKMVLPPLGVEPVDLVLRRHEGEPAWRIAQAMCAHGGLEIDEREARRLGAEKNIHFRRETTPSVYPGVAEILDFAARSGIRTAVVTGTSRENLLHILGERCDRFDALFCDGDFARPKPYPDPYLTAMRYFDLAPERCVVIENAPMGIRAAKAAGLYCIALETTLPSGELQQADLILPGHAALLQWLEQRQKSLD
ncbi:MAG TPA: HAD family phosphatase [bacterium]|nr:HAD family phosphatase [bacterium]HQG45089.1 HAD family phosphatase [bacterium]HQI47159.1 HAD family phosphatase [bacterium]HQJ63542.1 HAD family phosphatase [bacterium]